MVILAESWTGDHTQASDNQISFCPHSLFNLARHLTGLLKYLIPFPNRKQKRNVESILKIESLRQMKSSYKQILTSIPTNIIVTDRQGNITFINDPALECLKLGNKKILGTHISQVSDNLNELLNDCLTTGNSQFHPNLVLKDKLFEVDISPVTQGENTIGSVYSFLEKKAVEANTPRTESHYFLQLQFDTTFNFADHGVWILDGEGVVLKVNPAAEKLIGIKAKDVVGEKIVRLAEKGVIDQALTPHILESRRPVTKLLYVLKTKKHIMSSGMPVLDEHGNIILVVVNEYDMTTLNVLQEQLEELRVVAEKYKNELSDLNLIDFKGNDIISESKEMKQILHVSLKLARLDVSNILILGESGTGKGLIAQFIHKNGKRKDKPFIQVNCAALPESLLEAELFGFEKGAFTGAGSKGKIGLFEIAQNGTILLDEIGELPLSVQAKLLKSLDDHEIMHIGGLKPIKINCTIIAATNRDLKSRVKEKKFREDLYHRLNAFNIQIPPLRERPEDIVALANYYLNRYNQEYGMDKRLSLMAINKLQQYLFPGNVRELKNMLKHGVVMSESNILDEIIPDMTENGARQGAYLSPLSKSSSLSLTKQLSIFEKSILEHAIRRHNTTRKIADHLKTSQSRIVRMLKKHGLSKAQN